MAAYRAPITGRFWAPTDTRAHVDAVVDRFKVVVGIEHLFVDFEKPNLAFAGVRRQVDNLLDPLVHLEVLFGIPSGHRITIERDG